MHYCLGEHLTDGVGEEGEGGEREVNVYDLHVHVQRGKQGKRARGGEGEEKRERKGKKGENFEDEDKKEEEEEEEGHLLST